MELIWCDEVSELYIQGSTSQVNLSVFEDLDQEKVQQRGEETYLCILSRRQRTVIGTVMALSPRHFPQSMHCDYGLIVAGRTGLELCEGGLMTLWSPGTLHISKSL